ncbi:MAG TPA: C69 family dipeptidase [Myxococcota bacterium]|nr:C69 family dipeptidase [Myxococcota bacterium]
MRTTALRKPERHADFNQITAAALAAIALVSFGQPERADACTNILVTKGASADGSTMISYSADSHDLYGFLDIKPAGTHEPGTMIDIIDWDTGKKLGQIPQAPVTWTVVGNINQHQVAIGETTFGGRPELEGPAGLIDYGSLMYLALQRSTTAREAIKVMTDLVAEYGYHSTGESFSISDPDEVWIMEMIGKGKDRKGAVWVARKIPDGYVSAHANQARIRQFPQDDPENTIFSPDVISFAREMGWFCGDDRDFSFADAYAPPDYGALRFCEARVWNVFNHIRPSEKIPADFVKAVPGASPMPLWIKPDRPVSVKDVMTEMRDHFEGTEFDLSRGVGAGPFGLPYRWRPLQFKVGEKEYFNERSIATQQTGFSFVAQCRGWLPDPVGGILWFGVDDTASSVYVPMYAGITAAPRGFGRESGNFNEFSWDSAFWVFSAVAEKAYSRYSDIIKDIRTVQTELESSFHSMVPQVDETAVRLHGASPELARAWLTAFSATVGDVTMKRWRDLWGRIMVKYNDGNVRNDKGEIEHPPLPDEWYRRIIQERPGFFEVLPVEAAKGPSCR